MADGAPALIVKVKVMVLVPEALVPVTVNVYVPGVAKFVFEIVNTDDPTGVTGFTEKPDVAPAGTPETLNVTGSV